LLDLSGYTQLECRSHSGTGQYAYNTKAIAGATYIIGFLISNESDKVCINFDNSNISIPCTKYPGEFIKIKLPSTLSSTSIYISGTGSAYLWKKN